MSALPPLSEADHFLPSQVQLYTAIRVSYNSALALLAEEEVDVARLKTSGDVLENSLEDLHLLVHSPATAEWLEEVHGLLNSVLQQVRCMQTVLLDE